MVIYQEPHREKGAPISALGFYSAGELRGELRFLLQLPRAPQLSLGPGCLGGLPMVLWAPGSFWPAVCAFGSCDGMVAELRLWV